MYIYYDIISYDIIDSKINMARKPAKKQKENLVKCTGEGKR